MADQKISQLADGGAPQDADQLVIARSGSSLSVLVSAVKALFAPVSRTLTAGTGLTGGGDLSADRTFTVSYGSSAGTAAQGNDSRLSDSRAPTGSAGGDLSGTYPNPAVKAITETSGPTDLVVGTVTDGQFLKRVGSTLVSAAGNAGTVTSVTATDTSIVVAGTGAAPTIATATLDVIATDHPPAADWSNNSHKITSLANGSGAQDAAAFGQIPTALPPNGSAGGDLAGTYPNPSVKAVTETSGPTDLVIGTITDGQFLKRVGSTLVSATPAGGTADQYPNTYLTVADETIAANTQVIYEDYLELAASFAYELATGAVLIVGDFATPLPPLDQYRNLFISVADEAIPANGEVVFSDFYELSAPFVSELSRDAVLQVGTGSSAITYVDAIMTAGVVIIVNSATYYDAITALFVPGTWLITWQMAYQVLSAGSQTYAFTTRLWDGTTPYSEQEYAIPVSAVWQGWLAALSGQCVVTLTQQTVLKLSGSSTRGTSAVEISPDVPDNSASSHTATRITGIKIA